MWIPFNSYKIRLTITQKTEFLFNLAEYSLIVYLYRLCSHIVVVFFFVL